MKNRISSAAVLVALLQIGCYSGVDVQLGPAALGESDPDGDAGVSTAGEPPEPDAPDDDDAEPPGDDSEPVEDPFEVPHHEVRLLPFAVRMTNLANLLEVEQDHFIFDELYTRRTILGDHDYANGVAPDLSWSPTKMSTWVRGLKPVCNSAAWLARFPSISADPAPLLREVLARDPDSAELEAYGELAENALNVATADELTCLTALSSLDFVTQ